MLLALDKVICQYHFDRQCLFMVCKKGPTRIGAFDPLGTPYLCNPFVQPGITSSVPLKHSQIGVSLVSFFYKTGLNELFTHKFEHIFFNIGIFIKLLNKHLPYPRSLSVRTYAGQRKDGYQS